MIRIALFIIIGSAAVQLSAQGIESVEQALKNANANEVANYFTSKLKYCVNDEVKFLSSSSAEDRLANFLDEHKPLSYSRKHEGGTGGETKYVVGELRTNKGNFRIHMYYKKNGERVQVDELRIIAL